MKKLTAAAIPSLPQGTYVDPLVPGLQLEVGVKRKTWRLRYRRGDQQDKLTLGHWIAAIVPEGGNHMSLNDAREKAREILGRVTSGAPVKEPKAIHPKDAGVTLEKALEQYEKFRLRKGGKGIKSLPEACRVLRFNLADHLKQPAKHLTTATMRDIRNAIDARAPIMANRFLGYAGPFIKWCLDEEVMSTSPLDRVRKTATEKKRERVLSHVEIRKVWQACENHQHDGESGKSFARLVRFLLTCAQRKTECATLRHGDIVDGYWIQDAGDNKSSREHKLKLPQIALDQIGKGEPGTLIFGGPDGAPLSNYDRMIRNLRKASGTSDWTLHDLRRSASTELQELGTEPHVVDSLLNHSIAGVGAHYLHATMNKWKADALKKWAGQLEKILAAKKV